MDSKLWSTPLASRCAVGAPRPFSHIRRIQRLVLEPSAVARPVQRWGCLLQPRPRSEASTMLVESSPRPALSVLVADDDEDMRTLIAETLRRDGHHVGEARDGVDLLERLGEALDDPSRRPVVVV